MDSKSIRLFRLRYTVLAVFYTIFSVILLILGYLLIYPILFPMPDEASVHYVMTQEPCIFEVSDVEVIRDINGHSHRYTTMIGKHGKFTFEGGSDNGIGFPVMHGDKYEGYEVLYKAYDAQKHVISSYVIRVCDSLPLKEDNLTLEQFQENVYNDLLKKVIYEYNLEYNSNLIMFCFLVLFLTILLLQLKYRKMRILFLRRTAEIAESRALDENDTEANT